jgi:3D (Asp-Asp-Asp) domain-containing protein
MKRLITIFALFLVLAPTGFAAEKSLLARVTVYWASGGRGSDRYTRQHKCATGVRLKQGHCAVDPRHIPYGSQVVFPDGTKLAAVDTGSAVKSRKAARKAGHNGFERSAIVIDRFFETKRQALNWAATHPLFMPVRVVSPGYRAVQQQTLPRGTMEIRRGVVVNTPQPLTGRVYASNSSNSRNSATRVLR